MPPAFFMALMPSVPSVPSPESITAIAFLPLSSAKEKRNLLMVRCGPRSLLLSESC